MLLLLYFLFLLIIYYRYKSVTTILLVLQVISLSLMFFVAKDYLINTPLRIFNLIFTALILTIIIEPWKYFSGIQEIYCTNEDKIKYLTRILIIISAFLFIALLLTSIYVLLYIENINDFKYSEGVFEEFMKNSLPTNVRRGFLLSYYLYPLSYFLIPLHFYYLSKRNFRLAILCFIMSLNIILFGLTFFSRWTITHYFLIYGSFLYLLKGSLDKIIKRNILIVFLILSTGLISRFIAVSGNRFEKDISYENTIPKYSKIQDVVLYNYFDYLSQWYNNSMEVLDKYQFETLKGQSSFGLLLSALNDIGLVDYNSNNYLEKRQKLLSDKWCMFSGLVSNWVYDFGYLISIFLALSYYYIIIKLKPYNNRLSLTNTFALVLLIQIPLVAIFYSFLGGILYAFLLWIPIYLYLKIYFKKSN